MSYEITNIVMNSNIKLPKIVPNKFTNNSGIRYNINHNKINNVSIPIILFLFSSLNIFIIYFILYYAIILIIKYIKLLNY